MGLTSSSKLTDCDGENSETDSSLDFALECGYLNAATHQELTTKCASIGRMLGSMIQNPDSFLLRPKKRPEH
ncbi:four helix bundle protein [Anatilimnocola aggregata]|uniref:four helix bundle protein n=1 Tax=Anatilimnocola aggregata TaxID=2528021 RepID=UPI00192E3277